MDWERSTTDICLYSPFLARALLSLPMIPVENHPVIQTMATDGKDILYNPEFVAKLTVQEIDGVRVHECLHVLLGHHVRMGHRSPEKWNHAADYEINQYVVDTGYTLPDGALLDAKYQGLTAEEIYDLLPDGQKMPKWGTVMPGAAPGTPEHAAMMDEWRKMMAGTSWGSVPDALSRAITQQLKPKRDLAAHVAAWLRSAMPGHDETWAPPSRRNSLLPSDAPEASGHVVACVDTSGSLFGTDDLVRFLCSVAGLADVGRLDVITGDAAVTGVWEDVDQETIERIAKEIKGGGGTDFRPLLDRAKREGPDAIVFVTDGYGEFGKALYVPTLWAMSTDVVAPWGETIRLKP